MFLYKLFRIIRVDVAFLTKFIQLSLLHKFSYLTVTYLLLMQTAAVWLTRSSSTKWSSTSSRWWTTWTKLRNCCREKTFSRTLTATLPTSCFSKWRYLPRFHFRSCYSNMHFQHEYNSERAIAKDPAVCPSVCLQPHSTRTFATTIHRMTELRSKTACTLTSVTWTLNTSFSL